MVHGLEHIVDQLLKERVFQLLEVDFFRDLPKRRMAVLNDLADVRHGIDYTGSDQGGRGIARPRSRRTL
jgi:hypothetical protein